MSFLDDIVKEFDERFDADDDPPVICEACGYRSPQWRPFEFAPWACYDCGPPQSLSVMREWRVPIWLGNEDTGEERWGWEYRHQED